MRWVFLAAAMAAGQVHAGAVAEHARPWQKSEVPYRFTTDLLKAAGAKGQDCYIKAASDDSGPAFLSHALLLMLSGLDFFLSINLLVKVDFIFKF